MKILTVFHRISSSWSKIVTWCPFDENLQVFHRNSKNSLRGFALQNIDDFAAFSKGFHRNGNVVMSIFTYENSMIFHWFFNEIDPGGVVSQIICISLVFLMLFHRNFVSGHSHRFPWGSALSEARFWSPGCPGFAVIPIVFHRIDDNSDPCSISGPDVLFR